MRWGRRELEGRWQEEIGGRASASYSFSSNRIKLHSPGCVLESEYPKKNNNHEVDLHPAAHPLAAPSPSRYFNRTSTNEQLYQVPLFPRLKTFIEIVI
jgi:hypothetical protein